jgi:ABC-type Na+ transport system ATPase subunit NatA
MQTAQAFYKEQISRYSLQLQQAKKNSAIVSIARLASFVAVAWSAYRWIKEPDITWKIATIGFSVLFILFIRIALTLGDKKKLLEKLLFVNNNEAGVLQNQPNQFNNGQAFMSNDNYSGDLDIFGINSLFHLLNRTTTEHGTQALAGLLQQSLLDKKAIEEQQEAVKALSEQKELRQLLTAHGLLHEEKEGNLHDVDAWLQKPPVLKGKTWVNVVRLLVPAYNIGAIIFYFFTDNYLPLLAGVFIGWVFIGVFAKQITHQHTLLGKKQSILEQYAIILKLFSGVNPGSSALLKQQQAIAAEAHLSIKKLSRLSGLFDQRINMLVILFLNSLFLYDLQCMWSLESWKAAHKDRFAKWIDCVGAVETLNALATFAFNNPAYPWPVVNATGLSIAGKGLAHPLIPAEECIANDFTMGMQEQLVLVTGSNMSGKTTFLRTVGVNLLLAQCGAPVCATAFAFTPMNILSSIRVSDSLQEHTSYFMAELKRLKQIIRHIQQHNTPSLVLIDEILRGTNSEDKTHGSEQFIKKLLQYNCLTMFATHDLSLGKLETELSGRLSNYCFESIIRDGELLFDYTLQRGIARNKNASFLMEKMEII